MQSRPFLEQLINRPRALISGALNLVLPHRCIACDMVLAMKGALCTECWNEMTFIGEPHCRCCGYPFELGEAGENLCNSCLDHPPSYDLARSALVYDAASRDVLLAFKHGDRTDLAPSLADWLARPLNGLEAPPDLIAPVPLHRWRLFQRRFNQAALLAGHLSRRTGLPHHPRLIRRVRATPSQGHMTPGQRRRNVARAFALDQKGPDLVQGRHILLIDDVLTTGATVNEIAGMLKNSGAARVSVLTLARALRPQKDV